MESKRKLSGFDGVTDAALDDAVWSALGDPTRRAILDLLRIEPRITRDLCVHFTTTRFAIMKHLKVLEAAGLVLVERRGKTRVNHLNPVPIQSIYRRWIKPFEALPSDRMLQLKRLVEEGEQNHD